MISHCPADASPDGPRHHTNSILWPVRCNLPGMRGVLLAAAVAIVLMLSGPRAAVAAPADNPPEIGLGAGQLLMGTAIASVALAVRVFSDGTPFELLGVAALVAGPAAVGGTVCTLGQNSKVYGGSCKSALVGAYLGALVSVPLAVLAANSGDGIDGTDYAAGPAILFMVGYALGTSIGATVGWHVGKEERSVWGGVTTPPPLPGADDQRWPELRCRPVRGARVAPGVSVPLLVLAF